MWSWLTKKEIGKYVYFFFFFKKIKEGYLINIFQESKSPFLVGKASGSHTHKRTTYSGPAARRNITFSKVILLTS